uniref:Transmembrane protein n=1 Tax=Syphacia muris TaxID=451379 RepID=A0A0N5AVT9_9BILA
MVCGPKCVGFVMFISLWGAIFLLIVGGLFFNESVGLLEDVPTEGEEYRSSWSQRSDRIKDLYRQNAYNSWVAAAINVAVFVLSGVRLWCLR